MRSLKRNFGYQMVYRILTVITPLITSPYLSRVLGVEALGKYSASQAYVNYFVLFAMLGIENYGNRSIAKIQENEAKRSTTFWNIYAVQFIASIMSIAVYIASIYCFIEPEKKTIYLLQGLWLIDSLLNINWFFFGCEQFKLIVTRNTIIKIASVACIILFVKKPSDLWIYIIIMGLSVVFAEGALWIFLPRFIKLEKPQWNEVKKNIIPVLHLFIPALALSVFHIMDKSMLNWLSDDVNSGYYYNADKLVNIPLQLITGMSAVMLPRIANTIYNEGSNKAKLLLKKSIELTLFLMCAVSFGIGTIADEFVPIFFGKGYEPCVILIECFVPVLIVKTLSDFIRTQYLIPSSNDKLYTIAVIGGAISNLIANYILIQSFGALGAVMGTLIAESVVLIFETIGVKKELSMRRLIGSHVSYLIFGGIMYVVVYVVSNIVSVNGVIKLCIQVGVGACTYLALCLLYWTINKKSIFHRYIPAK